MNKIGTIYKNFDHSTHSLASLSEEDLRLINQYTLRELKSEDLFCFRAVLCDNEVDRTGEQFTRHSLDKLAVLFAGKTFIADHNRISENQKARIYKLEVEALDRLNSLGEPYCRLVASCYMANIEENRGLIAEIEAGVKKEVSVGVAVKQRICSVCGRNSTERPCSHIAGKRYKNELCVFRLEEPADAYEVSFVAVPAQRNAAVMKKFDEEGSAEVYRIRMQILNA